MVSVKLVTTYTSDVNLSHLELFDEAFDPLTKMRLREAVVQRVLNSPSKIDQNSIIVNLSWHVAHGTLEGGPLLVFDDGIIDGWQEKGWNHLKFVPHPTGSLPGKRR